jgi:hypothetical protein
LERCELPTRLNFPSLAVGVGNSSPLSIDQFKILGLAFREARTLSRVSVAATAPPVSAAVAPSEIFDRVDGFPIPPGDDKKSVPSMRGTNGGSVDNVPFRIVPDRGQRPEYGVERAASIISEKAGGIFSHKHFWAESRNNP